VPAPPPPASTHPTGKEEGKVLFQEMLRTRLDRENELIVQRTDAMLASQAFLFAAYAIAVTGQPDPSLWHRLRLLIVVIPWISLVSLLLFQLTIWAGILASVRLRRYVAASEDPRVWILHVGRAPLIMGVAGPVLIPVMLVVTWLVLLLGR
jgi:hypothetical protein